MRNWSVFGLRIAGVEMRLHITFLFLLIFVLLSEASRVGPRVVLRACILTFLVLVSVVLHELGHAFTAVRQGFPMKAVILLPLGGIAIGDPSQQVESARRLRREALIAMSGPLVNAILAAITAAALLSVGEISRLRTLPV